MSFSTLIKICFLLNLIHNLSYIKEEKEKIKHVPPNCFCKINQHLQ